MQAKRLHIAPYDVPSRDPEQDSLPFNVAESLVELLFSPSLELNKADAVRADLLAQRLLTAAKNGEEHILLDDAEYSQIARAVETHKGWPRQAIPIIHRVDNAETVEVEEVTDTGDQ